ncbi:MAG: N-formylglutamate amidohydrolase [Alphaproteobacteria bacterium]
MEIPGIFRVNDPAGPAAPLVLDVPHSGRTYPGDFQYACPFPLLRQTEDAYVDELMENAVEHGATVLTALFPRALIDVNRAVDDLDPAVVDGVWPEPLQPSERTLGGLGLVRRMCRGGVPVYKEPLAIEEIDRRLRQYYHPYHRALARILDGMHRRFGAVWHIDCHSMPSKMYDGSLMAADFVLGDRDGTSCSADFTALCAEALRGLGYKVVINDPYKGVEIVRRHGQPGQARHSLQLEINRALYLDEDVIQRASGFDKMRADLGKFIQKVAAALPYHREQQTAAE